jgi:hypothetical protein
VVRGFKVKPYAIPQGSIGAYRRLNQSRFWSGRNEGMRSECHTKLAARARPSNPEEHRA